MASILFIFLAALSLSSISAINGSNITAILADHPEYSVFNRYLTETKLADEINSRTTVTVLALTNGAMDSLVKGRSISSIKNGLSLHIVLDYFDGPKLHEIADGSILSTTLYQTTGNAPGNLGSVNITDVKGGKVAFGGSAAGAPLASTYTKSVKQIPYNLSVIEISQPIIVPAVLDAGASTGNITALLEKAGCKTFAGLISKTGVLKDFQTAAGKGLTIFAPNDEAFKAADLPDLGKLTSADLDSLLRYHALASYTPTGSLKTQKDSLSTLATNGASKYGLSVSTAGDSITLHTGVDDSRVASTVIDSTPLVIYTVESVLLPTDIFGEAPSPAPGPAPESSPSSAPSPADDDSPSPSPSPFASPPVPPSDSPAGSPAEGPGPSSDNADSTADKAAAAGVGAPALFLTVSVSLIVGTLMS